MCHPTHDYAHLLTPEDPAMTTTPATCQLAQPIRTGGDGRPYTTCGVRVNPAGYCCECGTRCARRTGDNTWAAACGAELREQWDGDLPGHSHHVTTCDLAPGHDDDHLGAILDPDTDLLTGEMVSWPAVTIDQLAAMYDQVDDDPQVASGQLDGIAALLAGDATLVYVPACPACGHSDDHISPADGCDSCTDADPRGPCAARMTFRQRSAALRDGHDYWTCQDVACPTCHGLDDRKPSDTNGHPSDSPGGIVGAADAAWAQGAYDAYQRQVDDAERDAYRARFIAPRPAILAVADALGLGDCGPGCTCRGQGR